MKLAVKTRVIGRKILSLDRVDSTNQRAWVEALAGAPEGTVIFAEEQTLGRGRHGRRWYSPRGGGLWCSVIARPEIGTDRIPLMTAIAALATAESIDTITALKTHLRFPNDVVINDRKVAGILVESRFISARPDLFIIGIGINVNISDFPPELRTTATSLSIETGISTDRSTLARALLESLDTWYAEMDGDLRPIRKAWRERSAVLGRPVRVRQGGKTYGGVVEDIDPLDGITLRLNNGHVKGFRGEHLESLTLA